MGKSMANLVTQAVLKISGLGLQWEITCHKMSCLECYKIHASLLSGTSRAGHALMGGENGGAGAKSYRFLVFSIMTYLIVLLLIFQR
jgi:hypothetical protein